MCFDGNTLPGAVQSFLKNAAMSLRGEYGLKSYQDAGVFDGVAAESVSGVSEELETARDYDSWLSQDTFGSRWMRFWLAPPRTVWLNTPVRWLPDAISLRPSDRILDIGCGYGGMLIYLQRRVGVSVPMEGLDCSPLMVERGRKEIMSRGLRDKINLRQGVATVLPYPDHSLDVVLCTYVIKHLSDPLLRQMLSEIRRVLKPGGRLCLWEAAPSRYPFMQSWNMKLLRKGWSSFLRLRAMGELQSFLEDAGYRSIRPYGTGLYYYYPPLPRAGFIALNPEN